MVGFDLIRRSGSQLSVYFKVFTKFTIKNDIPNEELKRYEPQAYSEISPLSSLKHLQALASSLSRAF